MIYKRYAFQADTFAPIKYACARFAAAVLFFFLAIVFCVSAWAAGFDNKTGSASGGAPGARVFSGLNVNASVNSKAGLPGRMSALAPAAAARVNSGVDTPVRADSFNAVKVVPRASLAELTGWKFIQHVSLESDLDSNSARPGDIVWGLLDDDCKWGAKLVAASDSLIKGHVIESDKTRTLLGAVLSRERRYHSGGSLTIQFDEIIDQDGRSWPITGKLCRMNDVRENAGGGAPRAVQVDRKGNIVQAGPTLTDKEKSIFAVGRIASAVPIPAGIFVNVVGVPAAMGVLGAACPAFVYNKPVNCEEKGVRTKAFVYGFVTNLPGVSVVAACAQKGDDVMLKAGDQLIVDMTFKDNAFCSRGRLAVTGSVIK